MICGNCKTTTSNIDHVRNCYGDRYGLSDGPEPTGYVPDPIYPRDTAVEMAVRSVGRPIASPVPDLGSGTRPVLPVTEPGIYFDGEHYYKVVPSQTSGHLYAKVWDAEWVYAPGAMRALTADMKVTAEQASAFGRLWGSCVFCSRLLTDERSIAVGYGPVCANHNGLPWGEANA